ncbi:MAG: hypothetical protein OXC80_11845 [Gammaproteobacteria bacterium]|nr:hypothetical protein [Gammaproteobacteria bacterium]
MSVRVISFPSGFVAGSYNNDGTAPRPIRITNGCNLLCDVFSHIVTHRKMQWVGKVRHDLNRRVGVVVHHHQDETGV